MRWVVLDFQLWAVALEWLGHEIQGDWADRRECRAKGDLLLIYRLEADSVIFVRDGARVDLFGGLPVRACFGGFLSPRHSC